MRETHQDLWRTVRFTHPTVLVHPTDSLNSTFKTAIEQPGFSLSATNSSECSWVARPEPLVKGVASVPTDIGWPVFAVDLWHDSRGVADCRDTSATPFARGSERATPSASHALSEPAA